MKRLNKAVAIVLATAFTLQSCYSYETVCYYDEATGTYQKEHVRIEEPDPCLLDEPVDEPIDEPYEYGKGEKTGRWIMGTVVFSLIILAIISYEEIEDCQCP